MELEKQIKKYRTQLHLSQEELADKIYVTRQSISNWETSKNYPDIHSLLLLSSLFQISLDELIKGDLELMKEQIRNEDVQAFHHQGKVLLILMTMMILSVAPLGYFFGYVGLAVYVIFAILAIAYSLKVEKFKKDNDIQTYREILAFSKGERLDEISKKEEIKKRTHQKVYACILMGVIGFIVAIVMLNILQNIF